MQREIIDIPQRIGTKQHIANIAQALLERIPLEEISAKLLIECAGVSKSTFYRHFKDVQDVVLWIYISGVNDAVKDCRSFESLTLGAYRFMAEHRSFIQRALSYQQQNNLSDYILSRSRADILNYARKALGEEKITRPLEKSIDFFCAGCRSVWISWVSGGMEEEPEEVVRGIMENMPPRLRPILADPFETIFKKVP